MSGNARSTNNSQVPKGYKQTEVGVIPEDWEVLTLGKYASFKTGPFGSLLHNSDYVDGGIPVINPMQINDGRLEPTYTMSITKDAAQRLSNFLLHTGNIVIGRRGEMGRCAYVNPEEEGWLCGSGSMIIRVSKIVDSQFLQRVLSSPAAVSAIENASVGSTMVNLNQSVLSNLLLALPPTKAEQEAIARTLSDTDALIEALEQLIAKKRHIKQGAMQELLRSREGWEKKSLSSLGVFSKGSGVRKEQSDSGSLPCIRYGEIYTRHHDYIKRFYSWISKDVAETSTCLKPGDLLFTASGETKEEIGKCVAFIDEIEAYAGGDIIILRLTNSNSLFMGYYLNTSSIVRQKASKGQGDAVVHISLDSLGSIQVIIPTVEEQNKIAKILSDMDAEIAALEAKLAKTRRLKQGMMHELLTGRIRLVEPEKSHPKL